MLLLFFWCFYNSEILQLTYRGSGIVAASPKSAITVWYCCGASSCINTFCKKWEQFN